MSNLHGSVVDWLEAERVCALTAIRATGVMSKIAVDKQMGVIDRAKGSIDTRIERSEVSALTIPGILWQIRARNRPATPAEHLVAAFGRRCWVLGLFRSHDFESEPAAWLDDAILRPFADECLQRLPDIEISDRKRLSIAADSLLAFIAGDTIASHEDVALEGLDVEAAITVRDVVLRPLTSEELGALHGGELIWEMTRPRRLPAYGMERVMLDVTEARPKDVQRRVTTRLSRIILGLQLLGLEPAGAGVLQQRDMPVSSGTLSLPLVLPRHAANATVCTPESLGRAVDFADRIPATIDDPRAPHEVALHRFQQGCADRTATDAIVDFVVALEAVLLPRESSGDIRFQGELRFRFGLHGARLLGRDADALGRKHVRKELTEIYDTRSTIVHGGSLDAARVVELRPVARRLAADVLTRGLESGWPTSSTFAELVLE